jgi:hypothetical protein
MFNMGMEIPQVSRTGMVNFDHFGKSFFDVSFFHALLNNSRDCQNSYIFSEKAAAFNFIFPEIKVNLEVHSYGKRRKIVAEVEKQNYCGEKAILQTVDAIQTGQDLTPIISEKEENLIQFRQHDLMVKVTVPYSDRVELGTKSEKFGAQLASDFSFDLILSLNNRNGQVYFAQSFWEYLSWELIRNIWDKLTVHPRAKEFMLLGINQNRFFQYLAGKELLTWLHFKTVQKDCTAKFSLKKELYQEGFIGEEILWNDSIKTYKRKLPSDILYV